MDVQVRNHVALDHEAGTVGFPLLTLRQSDPVGDNHQLGHDRVGDIQPAVNLSPRHNESMPRLPRFDREKRHTQLVFPDEPRWLLAADDAGEKCAHATRSANHASVSATTSSLLVSLKISCWAPV